MRVKLKTLMAGPSGVGQIGQVITVGDDEGKQLLAGGFAELVDVSAMNAAMGVSIALITSGKRKGDGNPNVPLDDAAATRAAASTPPAGVS